MLAEFSHNYKKQEMDKTEGCRMQLPLLSFATAANGPSSSGAVTMATLFFFAKISHNAEPAVCLS